MTWYPTENGDYIYKNASGSIASFEDGQKGMPIKSGKFTFNAVQASGTPTPSVPIPINGFTGMNICYVDFNQLASFASDKIPTARNGITFSSDDNKSCTINNTTTANSTITGWYNFNAATANKNGHVFIFISTVLSGSTNGSVAVQFTASLNAIGGNAVIGQSRLLKSSADNAAISLYIANNTSFTNFKYTFVCVDLTQMFGSKIAEYIYSVEQNTTGTGVALFRQIFPNNFYDYNEGGTKVTVASVNGTPYPSASVTWTSEGTLYGGYVKVNADGSAELWATRYSVDMGDLSYTEPQEGVLQVTKTVITNVTNKEPMRTNTSYVSCEIFKLVNNQNNYRMVTNVTAEDAPSTFNGYKIVYELATPVKVCDLPDINISTLFGTNNIFHDANGDSEITYILEED